MSDLLIKLIKRYQQTSRECIGRLESKFGPGDLLKKWRQHQIPREGVLEENVAYAFHGVGCRFHSNEWDIDVDFSANGQGDGFDAWRLWLYAQSLPDSSIYPKDRSFFDAELRRLHALGLLKLSQEPPSPHLYFLAEKADGENCEHLRL